MPKKNGFLIFMEKRKYEMQNTGIRLTRGLAEVAELVDQEWQEMPDDEKQIYKDMAQSYNENVRKQQMKDQPESAAALMDLEDLEEQGAAEAPQKVEYTILGGDEMRRIIVNITKNQRSVSVPIILIKFSCYEDITGEILAPAESAICVFSVEKGIFDNYSGLIDPVVNSPTIKMGAKKLALPQPNYHRRLQNYLEIFNEMKYFLSLHSKKSGEDYFLFCLSKDMKSTTACIEWLFLRAGSRFNYKLLSLDLLIQHISCNAYTAKLQADMTNSLADFKITPRSCRKEKDVDCDVDAKANGKNKIGPLELAMEAKAAITGSYVTKPGMYPFIAQGIFFHSYHVELYLQADNYAYHEELACLYHMERRDGVYHCAMNIVNRYAYCLLDVLVSIFDVIPIPGMHYPTLNDPPSECNRRRNFLQTWALINYSELATAEKALDADLVETWVMETTGKRSRNLLSSNNCTPEFQRNLN